ncbi:choice-of-anchor A family protein [Streptomyces sp. NPDC057271]|uniref:choice-of-anchor A family protein n=1 Tax=unclassified Streptomyces TaxID=2593676 RepID=UPI003630F37F
MRMTATAVVLALTGSMALASTAAAGPAAAVGNAPCDRGLGAAQPYAEFVAGNAAHSPDSEGAVVIGGDADFTGGFTAGGKLTDTEVDALPGRAALVVAGDVDLGGGTTTAMRGDFVHGGALKNPGAAEALEGKVVQAPPPVDVPGAFRDLRALSETLSKTGTTTGAIAELRGTGHRVLALTGVDPTLNVFTVDAAELEKAQEIELTVPDGATTLVNIAGDSYDMAKAGTTAVKIFDWDAKTLVIDDKNTSANDGRTRAGLLWNLRGEGTFAKSSQAAWPGAVLAPFAHVDLGTGAPVNGTVVARTLKATDGAETHHVPFQGCLSAVGVPAPTPVPTPTRTSTPTSAAPVTPPPAPSTTASPSSTAPSTGKHLADTGAAPTGLLLGSGLALIGAGAVSAAALRRRARKPHH